MSKQNTGDVYVVGFEGSKVVKLCKTTKCASDVVNTYYGKNAYITKQKRVESQLKEVKNEDRNLMREKYKTVRGIDYFLVEETSAIPNADETLLSNIQTIISKPEGKERYPGPIVLNAIGDIFLTSLNLITSMVWSDSSLVLLQTINELKQKENISYPMTTLICEYLQSNK